MLVGSMYFAFTGAFAKLLGAQMPSIEVVFWRNIIGLGLCVWALAHTHMRHRGGRPFLLFFRGFVGTLSLIAFFYNIAHIGLAEAYTFSKTSPIFLSIIGAIFLHEALTKRAWAFVFIGFLGVVCIMQPNIGFSKVDLMGLFSGFFAALAYVSIHELRKYYDTQAIVFSFVLQGTLLPAFCMLACEFVQIPSELDFLFDHFVMPDARGWLYIVLMGAAGYVYQGYVTKSYAAGRKAGNVAVISYSDIVFTLFMGILLGDSFPNALAFFGIVLVIASGVMIARER